MKVLVVDDEAIARTQLAALVQKAGHTAIRASNGQRAWGVIEDNPDVSLVIADVHMPEMTGDQLLRLVRASREHAKLPFVVVTTSSAKSTHFKDMGATDVLVKPFEAALVTMLVTGALTRTSSVSRLINSNSTLKVFDWAELVERVGDDEAIAKEVIAVFRAESTSMRAGLQKAFDLGDQVRVIEETHKLKGALLNLGAQRAGQVAKDAEAAFRSGKGGEHFVVALKQAIDELVTTLDARAP